MRDNASFIKGLKKLNLFFDDHQLSLFERYYDELIEKNEVMNLTAITEYEDVIQKHFLDSLLISLCSKKINKNRILDLGTGAGFPGIPLKIAFPETEIVLMDSLNKRVLFLQETIEKLDLKGITAVHGRAEEMALLPLYREKFDLCVSRAVAKLSTLSEYCIPFVKVGGCFISYKAKDCEIECREAERAAQILSGSSIKTESFSLPGTGMERTFVIIEKKKSTERKYPRGQGKPQKQPL